MHFGLRCAIEKKATAREAGEASHDANSGPALGCAYEAFEVRTIHSSFAFYYVCVEVLRYLRNSSYDSIIVFARECYNA